MTRSIIAGQGEHETFNSARRKTGKILRLVISASVLAYCFSKVPLFNVLGAMAAARPVPLTGALLIALASQVAVAARLKRLADAYRLGLSTFEVFQINLATIFYGLFLPAGNFSGIVIRFYKMSAPQKEYVGTVLALLYDRIAATITLCVIGIVFWLMALPIGAWSALGLMFVALVVLLVVQALLFVDFRLSGLVDLRALLVRLRLLPKSLETTGQVPTLPRSVLFYVFALSIFVQLLGIVTYSLVAWSLGLDISFVTMGWVRSAAILIAILPVSIAGLGVRDGTLLLLLTPFGIPAVDTLAFSLLVFAATILIVAILGGLLEAKRLLF